MGGWKKAAEVLKNGGVVIIPSESSYGMAALVSNPAAVKKLYQIKERADNKPSLIIVGSMDQANTLVNFSLKAEGLAEKYWPARNASPARKATLNVAVGHSDAGGPGGLTLVLDSKKADLPEVIYGENKSLAIRLPDNQNLRDLALEVGPFILPSANFNNEKPPYKKEEINPKLAELVDFILDEPTGGNEVSTLIDARGEKIKVLRQGAVNIDNVYVLS